MKPKRKPVFTILALIFGCLAAAVLIVSAFVSKFDDYEGCLYYGLLFPIICAGFAITAICLNTHPVLSLTGTATAFLGALIRMVIVALFPADSTVKNGPVRFYYLQDSQDFSILLHIATACFGACAIVFVVLTLIRRIGARRKSSIREP